MEVFVTGGAGFVGRHVVTSLLKSDHKVTIFDNISNSKITQISDLKRIGASFIKGDITNYKLLLKSLHRCDFVIHLAAKIDVDESILFPELTHFVNVTGTLNLLRACVIKKVPNIIAASSAAVYGDSAKMPIYEYSPTVPLSPYGATKIAMEKYLQAFSSCYSINCISLRFFNIYGHGQSHAYAGVIEKFIQRISCNKPLIIYGDGKNTRDFVSVEDAVSSIQLAMKKIDGKKGQVYNIASGASITINKLARLMISLSGKKLSITHEKPRIGDIRNSRASIKLAKKELGYSPKTHLKNGLEELLKQPS